MSITDRLRSIKIGKSAKIAGKTIVRLSDDEFKIDDDFYASEKAAELLSEKPATDVTYTRTGFILRTPLGAHVGSYKCHDRQRYNKLLEHARSKGLYVWIGDLREIDGKEYIIGPYSVEWSSIPDLVEEKKLKVELECRECNLSFKSQSGYTLHMKARHSS
jgi:hypothetical protein